MAAAWVDVIGLDAAAARLASTKWAGERPRGGLLRYDGRQCVDGEVWASLYQRTRDGAHRLRGSSKVEAQSSLPSSNLNGCPGPWHGLAGRRASGRLTREAVASRDEAKGGLFYFEIKYNYKAFYYSQRVL